MADIDLDVTPYNTGTGWTPLFGFWAQFDGNNHTISGLYINDPDREGAGLFAHFSPGVRADGFLRNVALVDVDITSGINVGALAGQVSVPTSNVFASGTVVAERANASTVGGLIGSAESKIDRAMSAVHVVGGDVGGQQLFGGLAGFAASGITNSYAMGSVTVPGTGAKSVGGLVGFADWVVSNNYSTAAVSVAADATLVGGFVGEFGDNGTSTGNEWDRETSGQASGQAGIPRTTSQMQSPIAPGTGINDPYNMWDASVWDFGSSSQYPALKDFVLSEARQRALLGGIALSVSEATLDEDSGTTSVTITGRLLARPARRRPGCS